MSKSEVSFVFVLTVLIMPLIFAYPSCSFSSLLLAEVYSIDVYTTRGGKGPNVPSAPFKVGENVVLYAESKYNGVPLQNKILHFEICGPSNPYRNMTLKMDNLTNSLGIASVSFRIGPFGMEHWQEILLGTWQVWATIEHNQSMVGDYMIFECTWDLTVDLFTQKGGKGEYFQTICGPFTAGEIVVLYMEVTNLTVPMPDVFVQFRIFENENPTYYNVFTNESGIAAISFRLPWTINSTSHIFCDATMTFCEYSMHDDIFLKCLASIRIQGDINNDGKVDFRDIALVASAFGSHPGQSKWNPNVDINQDDKVDVFDIALTAKNFGKQL
ncbi:MAG: dockerin type I domain-containing protein [Candidatus Bathyarchaeia archaeon]